MSTALIILIASVLTLVFTAGVFRIEDARNGKLLFAVRLRGFFDAVVTKVVGKLSKVETYLGKGFVRLMLHYFAHGILRRVLSFVSSTQKKLEHLLRRNKQVAKEIRTKKEKTHLDKIAEHKEETALTEAQKKKMRSHE
jgi:hypothetical protein